MSMRGFACIALDNPKTSANIGGALRASGCYGAALVVIGGPRPERLSKLATDTQKAWRHIPHVLVPDVFDAIPYDAVPIAVDLIEGAIPLPRYCHPERAFYIFGAEDATLGRRVLDRCRDKIVVPTRACMNLAATVNVVLYDRISKQCTSSTTSMKGGRGLYVSGVECRRRQAPSGVTATPAVG